MSTVFNLLRAEFPPAEQCKAAPALLDACKLAREWIPQYMVGDKLDQTLEAAIALATSPPSAPASAGKTTSD